MAILRSHETNLSAMDEESIDSEPCIKRALHKESINRQRFVIHDKRRSPFWHLQRNRRGREDPFEHTIVWNQDSEESASERLGWDFNPKTGAGSGVDFVRSLRRGDRVAVIARAKVSDHTSSYTPCTSHGPPSNRGRSIMYQEQQWRYCPKGLNLPTRPVTCK